MRALFLVLILLATTAFPQPANLKEYRDVAQNRDGNATRGKEVFFNETKTSCVKCHTIDGSAGKAGPDLYAIGDKFPRRDLIQSILEPFATIAVGYTSKKIFAVTQENRALKTVHQIATSPQFIASFGIDRTGEIYVVGYEGMIYKLDFTGAKFDQQELITKRAQ